MVVPQWLNKYITSAQIQKLEKHIESVEAHSDVEIVPVIVRSSSSYPQTSITLMLSFFILVVLGWNLFGFYWDWDGLWSSVVFLLSALFAIFVVIPWLSSFGLIQMWMTHRFVEAEQCWKRAQLEYFSGRTRETKKKNGVLVYISMLERRVIIQCDEAIKTKINEEVWEKAVHAIISGIKQKKMAEGIESALNIMDNFFKIQFPLAAKTENVLPNTFIIKD
jgi:putative membrane protein